MIFERYEHPGWLSNTYLVADADGGAAMVIDAGGPVEDLLAEVRRRRLRVSHILNTHHHHDHVKDNARLVRETGALLCAHRLDAPLIEGVHERLEDRQTIRAGGLAIEVLHIPGHTAGQAAYVLNRAICFTGDTLFRGSVGGTTAPGHTTFEDLRHSLLERLCRLDPSTRIAPGHSHPTTIGEELRHNPFLRVMRGVDPEGTGTARFGGRPVQLIVWGRDYDGGFKAWIRHEDGADATVPGSLVERPTP